MLRSFSFSNARKYESSGEFSTTPSNRIFTDENGKFAEIDGSTTKRDEETTEVTGGSTLHDFPVGSVGHGDHDDNRFLMESKKSLPLDTKDNPDRARDGKSATKSSKGNGSSSGGANDLSGNVTHCRCEYPGENLYTTPDAQTPSTKSSKTSKMKTGKGSRSRNLEQKAGTTKGKSKSVAAHLDTFGGYAIVDGLTVLPSNHVACRNVRFICPGETIDLPLWSYQCTALDMITSLDSSTKSKSNKSKSSKSKSSKSETSKSSGGKSEKSSGGKSGVSSGQAGKSSGKSSEKVETGKSGENHRDLQKSQFEFTPSFYDNRLTRSGKGEGVSKNNDA